MDKRRAIQIMTKAAQLYKENLEDQNIIQKIDILILQKWTRVWS